MNDVNTFIISGLVESITYKDSGFAVVKLSSVRENKNGGQIFAIELTVWKDKIDDNVKEHDFVVAQGYVSSRLVERKDGKGSFPSMSLIATTFTLDTSKKKEADSMYKAPFPNSGQAVLADSGSTDFNDIPF